MFVQQGLKSGPLTIELLRLGVPARGEGWLRGVGAAAAGACGSSSPGHRPELSTHPCMSAACASGHAVLATAGAGTQKPVPHTLLVSLHPRPTSPALPSPQLGTCCVGFAAGGARDPILVHLQLLRCAPVLHAARARKAQPRRRFPRPPARRACRCRYRRGCDVGHDKLSTTPTQACT